MASLGWPPQDDDLPPATEPGGGGSGDDIDQVVAFVGKLTVPAGEDAGERDFYIFPSRDALGLRRPMLYDCNAKNLQFGAVASGPRPYLRARIDNDSLSESDGLFAYLPDVPDPGENAGETVNDGGYAIPFVSGDRWRMRIQVGAGTYDEFTVEYTIQFQLHAV